MRTSLACALAGALLLAACAPTSRFPSHRAHRDGGVGRKLVADKREKSMLVAFDRTVCLVTPDRYRQVRVGDDVWCSWRREGRRAREGDVRIGGRLVPEPRPRTPGPARPRQ